MEVNVDYYLANHGNYDFGKVSSADIPVFSFRFQKVFSRENEEQAFNTIKRENQLAWFFRDILQCFVKEGFGEDVIKEVKKKMEEALNEEYRRFDFY